MSKITVNSRSTGKFKTEAINNRPHIVTEMVSIEGDSVMNSLFYPLDEVRNSYSQLDALPAPAGHPTVNGENISAFHPLAINAHNVGGMVRNPRLVDSRVINELVFDIETASKDDRGKEIVRRIESGESIGVSTGLNAKINKTNGKAKGREYSGVVNEIKFDHVAVLLNEKPAGENTFTINEDEQLFICNFETEVNDMDKEKLVLAIIGNSSNSYKQGDKDSLMSMSEDALVNALYSGVSAPAPSVEDAQKVITDAGMTIANAEYNADEFGVYLANKDSFAEFQAGKAEERKAKTETILANSKMTQEQVDSMSEQAVDNLLHSLTPKQDYAAQGQSVNNNDRSGAGGTFTMHNPEA